MCVCARAYLCVYVRAYLHVEFEEDIEDKQQQQQKGGGVRGGDVCKRRKCANIFISGFPRCNCYWPIDIYAAPQKYFSASCIVLR